MAVLQALQPQQGDHVGQGLPAGGLVLLPPQAAEDILGHRHVGEQGVVLEQVAHPPLLGRQVDALVRVEEHLAVQDDFAPVRPLNPGDTF